MVLGSMVNSVQGLGSCSGAEEKKPQQSAVYSPAPRARVDGPAAGGREPSTRCGAHIAPGRARTLLAGPSPGGPGGKGEGPRPGALSGACWTGGGRAVERGPRAPGRRAADRPSRLPACATARRSRRGYFRRPGPESPGPGGGQPRERDGMAAAKGSTQRRARVRGTATGAPARRPARRTRMPWARVMGRVSLRGARAAGGGRRRRGGGERGI